MCVYLYLCVHVMCIWYAQEWVHMHMYVYKHVEVKGQHQVSSLIAAHIIVVVVTIKRGYYYYCEEWSLTKARAQ